MVNIQLDSHWNLESDTRQWILSYDGRYRYFFTRLGNALNEYLELKIRGSDAKSILGLEKAHKSCLQSLQHSLTLSEIGSWTTKDLSKEKRKGGLK